MASIPDAPLSPGPTTRAVRLPLRLAVEQRRRGKGSGSCLLNDASRAALTARCCLSFARESPFCFNHENALTLLIVWLPKSREGLPKSRWSGEYPFLGGATPPV